MYSVAISVMRRCGKRVPSIVVVERGEHAFGIIEVNPRMKRSPVAVFDDGVGGPCSRIIAWLVAPVHRQFIAGLQAWFFVRERGMFVA